MRTLYAGFLPWFLFSQILQSKMIIHWEEIGERETPKPHAKMFHNSVSLNIEYKKETSPESHKSLTELALLPYQISVE